MAQTEMNEMPEASDTSPVSAQDPAATPEDDDNALRRKLLSRVAVAGVVILGLLGGLAVFEVLNKPQEPALPKMATAPIEAPAAAEPAKPAESVAEDKAESVAAEPERTETVFESPKGAKPLTLPATPRTASIKPPPPAAAHVRPDAKQEIAKALPERSAPIATASTPPAAAATKPMASLVDGAKRFLVQIGVFSNHANAEELVTKLQAAGIPAQIESRVQVGPFASRAEADAARAKLKTLGIDDGLLVRR